MLSYRGRLYGVGWLGYSSALFRTGLLRTYSQTISYLSATRRYSFTTNPSRIALGFQLSWGRGLLSWGCSLGRRENFHSIFNGINGCTCCKWKSNYCLENHGRRSIEDSNLFLILFPRICGREVTVSLIAMKFYEYIFHIIFSYLWEDALGLAHNVSQFIGLEEINLVNYYFFLLLW